MRTVLLTLVVAGALLARGADAAAPAAPVVASSKPASGGASAEGTNSTGKPAKEYLSTTVVDPEARELKPRDGFRFSIDEDPPSALGGGSLDSMVFVSDGGEAMFPVSRSSSVYVKVNVAGRKIAEVRKELKERLDQDYYKNSTIHLDLVQVNRGGAVDQTARVTFYGEMTGAVAINEGEQLTISEAVLRVGRSEFADLRKVKIHRLDKETGRDNIIVVDVEKILKKGDRRDDKVLQAGDRVEVREKGLF